MGGGHLEPTDIKVIDPACGSAHILVESYNILKKIYLEYGHRLVDIPKLILENNIYGLDIDGRASQISSLILLLTASKDNKKILDLEIKPHILSFENYHEIKLDFLESYSGFNTEFSLEILKRQLSKLKYAKTYGSLIEINEKYFNHLENLKNYLNSLESFLEVEYLIPFVDILIQLSRRYDCLVANPPYMGATTMSIELKSYITKSFKEYKNDLCTAFMKRAFSILKTGGYNAQINIQSWMFLSSFKDARLDLLNNYSLVNLNHLASGLFKDTPVETCSFIFKNQKLDNFISTFIKNDFSRGSNNK
ncbi:MAG: N-6 DNA methylase, partial [Psittacicella sp.]